nr:RagB/SusD family nutrient uptake outer membrane protein [Butyricimonas synergistica]
MKKLSCIITAFIFLFQGCDYLDVVPKNDVQTVETIFEKRSDVDVWLKGCYVLLTNPIASILGNPAYLGADEIVSGEYFRQYSSTKSCTGTFIGDGLQMSQEPYGNIWKRDGFYAAIRYCNIFFEKVGGVNNMPDREKRLWTAELKALKAHFYFELMRRYGPIILVPENIDPYAETDIMQQPRQPIDTVVKAIVSLLDEAMKDLPPLAEKDVSRWAFHSLESAATLKAYTYLYAASPLFNGNTAYANFTNKKGELLFPAYDKEKWRQAAEAADSAIQICLNNGKQLIAGISNKNTDLLKTMEDIEYSVHAQNFINAEATYMLRKENDPYSQLPAVALPYFESTDEDYNAFLLGCVSPSMKIVEMYYTEHGLPIDADKEWDYSARYQMGKETNPQYRDVVPLNENVLNLHLRREPRFYANIAADRCYWQRGKDVEQNILVRAYRGERFGSQSSLIMNNMPQNLSGYWIKKGSYSDVSGRNYSEAMNREDAVIIFRLADLYLMKAEAWNEYEGPLVDRTHVYEPLNVVRERAGIPDVESAWLTYSKTPDKVKTQQGMQEIIRREWNIEFAFEGRRFWNLRRWLLAGEELNTKLYGWNILGTTAQQFYNNYEGPVVVWSKRQFLSPRDYLFPIRSEEVMVAGCVQNPNW